MTEAKRETRDLRPALVFLTGDLLAVPIPLEREKVILGRALEADAAAAEPRLGTLDPHRDSTRARGVAEAQHAA